jgi:elongation factor G
VAVQIPVGEGPAHTNNPFRGVVDLIDMKMLVFDAETEGFKVDTVEIPEDSRDMAELWRSLMLEKLYEYSDELIELGLEKKPIPAELIHKVLHDAAVSMQIQPVLCGSALHGIGVQPLLNAVTRYLPSPLERPPVEGLAVSSKGKPQDKKEIRKPDPQEPFAGLVFKILPAKTGDIYWIRVYSGQLKANSRMLNPEKGVKENVSQLWHIHATKKDRDGQVDMVDCGDIVGVIGPRESITGDTLCDPKHPIVLEHIQFPETVISMAIEPESTSERDKLADTLEMLKRQDPTLSVKTGESGQTLISGMGELHLEVIKNRLLRDFKLNVKFHKPQVSYRESIAREAIVTGECDRQIGGKVLFARVKLKLRPTGDEQEKAVEVINSLPADRLPGDMLGVVLEELANAGEGGGEINGFPLMKLRVELLDVETREEGAEETAFRIAVADAFRKGLQEGSPQLLEPIMRLSLTTPEEHMGDLVNDLQQRRGIVAKTESKGAYTAIEAHAPLENLFGYSSAMRSLSQGRAGCSMEPLRYDAAPPEVVKKYVI